MAKPRTPEEIAEWAEKKVAGEMMAEAASGSDPENEDTFPPLEPWRIRRNPKGVAGAANKLFNFVLEQKIGLKRVQALTPLLRIMLDAAKFEEQHALAKQQAAMDELQDELKARLSEVEGLYERHRERLEQAAAETGVLQS